ncbi:hypothetical protein PAPHI01_0786 [Pancytospora philotis]|nr:hypothetical protein PAPHI01_0786 [Pancytospora philotis]
MKLHVAQKAVILSQAPQLPPVQHNGRLIYYASPYVHVADIESGRIVQKLRYEDVQVIKIFGGRLYLATSDIYVIDLESYEIAEIIKVSKVLINNLVDDPSDHSIILSQINGAVAVYSGTRLVRSLNAGGYCDAVFKYGDVYGYASQDHIVVYKGDDKFAEGPMPGLVGVFADHHSVYSVDESGIVVDWLNGWEHDLGMDVDCIWHNIDKSDLLVAGEGGITHFGMFDFQQGAFIEIKDIVECHSGEITSADPENPDPEEPSTLGSEEPDADEEYESHADECESCGLHISDEESEPNTYESEETAISGSGDESPKRLKAEPAAAGSISEEDELVDDDLSRSDEEGYLDSGEADEDSVMSGEIDALKSALEAEERERSSEATAQPKVRLFDDTLIYTGDKCMILDEFWGISKIFAFNEDITGSVRYGDTLIVSTTSGQLVYTDASRYGAGEYLFDARVHPVHTEAITGLALYGDVLMTGSKDRTAVLWALSWNDRGQLALSRLKTFRTPLSPISTVGCGYGTAAIATFDNILQLHSVALSCPDVAGTPVTVLSSENTLVQCAHAKAINHIAVTPAYVVSSSSDKTAKIFTHAGALAKTVQSDKVLHCTFSDRHLAVCSHKAIKVFNSASLEPVASFQTRKPVLSSCFFGDFLFAASDVLRLYDLKKSRCVKSYDLGVVNAWSFDFPFLCGDNKIVVLTDESERVNARLADELRAEKEENMLVDVYCRSNNFRDALAVAARREDYRKMFSIVCRGFYAQQSLDFLDVLDGAKNKLQNMLLKNPGLKHAEVFNLVLERVGCPAQRAKLQEVCRKHYQAINEIFTELLALDIFDQ